MKPLSPRAKAALAQYRSQHALPADARERARRTLAARIAAGQVAAVTSAELEPPRLASRGLPSVGRARLLRWSVVGGIGGFALLGGLWLGVIWLQPSVEARNASPTRAGTAAVVLALQSANVASGASDVTQPGTTSEPARRLSRPAATSASTRTKRAQVQIGRDQKARSVSEPARAAEPALPGAGSSLSANGDRAAVVMTVPSLPKQRRSEPLLGTTVVRPTVVPDKPQAAPDRSLDAEVALLRAAHEQLRAGQPLRALSALSQHAERFPQGELLQMRKVTRIMALCALDKVDAARDEAARFLAQHASSSYAARVRQVCAAGLSATSSTLQTH